MVDLHQSLRPTGQEPPPPVREIAARAGRRKRRRLGSTAGLVMATVGLLALALNSLPDSSADSATVADVADSPTADRADDLDTTPPTVATDTATSTTISTTIPATEPADPGEQLPQDVAENGDGRAEPGPMTTPGIRISTTVTSEWEDGYCVQIDVINDGVEGDGWQVVLDIDGRIDTLWNASVVEPSVGTFVFSGQDGYNATIRPGATTSFGTCVDTGAG